MPNVEYYPSTTFVIASTRKDIAYDYGRTFVGEHAIGLRAQSFERFCIELRRKAAWYKYVLVIISLPNQQSIIRRGNQDSIEDKLPSIVTQETPLSSLKARERNKSRLPTNVTDQRNHT